jgi:hypothetical protein
VFTSEDDKTVGFCFILSNSTFDDVALYITDASGLKMLDADNHLIKDFSIDKNTNYLKCDSVNRLLLTQEDMNHKNELIKLEQDTSTFIDFINMGAANEFVLIDNESAESDKDVIGNVTLFNEINIAQNTMSVFCPIIADNTIHNKMLLVANENKLEIKPFYFATNTELDLQQPEYKYISYVRKVLVNNIDMYLYKMEDYRIYPSTAILNPALINKLMYRSVRLKSILDSLKDFRKSLNLLRGFEDSVDSISWNGGGNSFENPYGVYLKSSVPSLSKSRRQKCIDYYFNLMSSGKSIQEIEETINTLQPDLTKDVILFLHNIFTSSDDLEEVMCNFYETRDRLRLELLATNSWLYKVRLYSYRKGIRLASIKNPILVGSEEDCYTLVNSKQFYEMR